MLISAAFVGAFIAATGAANAQQQLHPLDRFGLPISSPSFGSNKESIDDGFAAGTRSSRRCPFHRRCPRCLKNAFTVTNLRQPQL